MIRSFPLCDTATFMHNKNSSLSRRAAKLRLGPPFDGPNMCHAWAFLDRGCDSIIVDADFKAWLALLFPQSTCADLPLTCVTAIGAKEMHATFNKPASFQASSSHHTIIFPIASLQSAGSRPLYSIRNHLCKARTNY